MPDWYEKACAEIEQELEDGVISYEEYVIVIRNLNLELHQSAYDQAESLYYNTIGGLE